MSYKVRTITGGVTLSRGSRPDWTAAISSMHKFLLSAKARVEALGLEVQTIRIATNSFEVQPLAPSVAV